jgi:tetratricopeptide (TPR) repeat protein
MKFKALLIPTVLLIQFASCGFFNSSKNEKKASDTLGVLENLDLLIEENPNNPAYYYQRAQYHLEKENVFSGKNDIQKAIKLDSTQSDYYSLLAEFNYLMKEVSLAKQNLEKALIKNPKNINAMLKYAELQLYLKDYPKVFDHVNRALKLDAYNAKGYFIKGMAYKETGDTNLAISSFQTCVEQDADYFNAHMQLGLLFAGRKNPICVTYYNNAIRVNPTMPEVYYALGYYYQENGNFQDALLNYDKMLEVSPNNAAALYNKGYIHLVFLKNPDEAITFFTGAIKAEPKYAEAYYNRGYAYELKNNRDAAKADYRNALSIKPEYELAAKGLKRLK